MSAKPQSIGEKSEDERLRKFSKLKIIIKNGKPFFNGKEIEAGSEHIKAEKVKDGARVR